MNLNTRLFFLISIIFFIACKNKHGNISDARIGSGSMPNLVTDKSGNIHLTYGAGDSIMYSFSTDQGKTFSSPALVAVVPNLFSFSMRGPQIAATDSGVVVIACSKSGNIFSYIKDRLEQWSQPVMINDKDTVAKEGLMALSAEGKTLFAVWLDVRDAHNKIFGVRSVDGGKSWSKNIMVYSSPDSTVCECCKPAVAIRGNNIYVMFRNWLNGNRDLYLAQSSDGGNSFLQAQKLGEGSWAINACPMDGGGVVVDKNNIPQTVWRRQHKIFACEAGKPEIEIGEGKSCVIESANNKNIYAWTENGEVVCVLPHGKKQHLGKGMLPIIKTIDTDHLICIWENDKQIYKAVLDL